MSFEDKCDLCNQIKWVRLMYLNKRKNMAYVCEDCHKLFKDYIEEAVYISGVGIFPKENIG